MKTKQLVVRSAVTIIATGLTLLSSGNSQASGRGPSGMRASGRHGGMNNGAIHQGVSTRAIMRAQGANKVIGRTSNKNVSLDRGRDDRGHGRHERGDDKGGRPNVTRGEREKGDDHGRHRERGDDKGGKHNSLTRGERERGDDHGRHHERGDDHGRGEREPGDDHGGGR
jgi:hypothetical protein